MHKNKILLVIFFIVILVALCEARFIMKLGNNLSRIADDFAEANAIRAGEGYVDQGFTANFGLPDVIYGGRFPHTGNLPFLRAGTFRTLTFEFKNPDEQRAAKSHIYTHPPPGPDLLVGLYTFWCGKGNIACFRIFPLIFSMLGFLAMTLLLYYSIGKYRTLFITLALLIVPMTTNMMHGLYYQSYAQTLLLIQLSLLVFYFRMSIRQKSAFYILFFILGFLQGFFSFDYFFITSLAAIPFSLFYHSYGRTYGKKMISLVLFPTLGFTCAHLIHLFQVYFYYASMEKAIYDLLGAVKFRFGYVGGPMSFITGDLKTVWQYLDVASGKMYLYLNLKEFILGSFLLMAIRQARIEILKPFKLTLFWESRKGNLMALLSAFMISFLWIFVMHNHAVVHMHFIPRHTMLMYFIFILVIAESIQSVPFDK